jgi:hypothetical protein
VSFLWQKCGEAPIWPDLPQLKRGSAPYFAPRRKLVFACGRSATLAARLDSRDRSRGGILPEAFDAAAGASPTPRGSRAQAGRPARGRSAGRRNGLQSRPARDAQRLPALRRGVLASRPRQPPSPGPRLRTHRTSRVAPFQRVPRARVCSARRAEPRVRGLRSPASHPTPLRGPWAWPYKMVKDCDRRAYRDSAAPLGGWR